MEIGFFVLLAVVAISVVVTCVAFFYVHITASNARARYEYVINQHKLWIDRFILSIVVEVLAVESVVFAKSHDVLGFSLIDSTLGIVHVVSFLLFVIVILLMRFWLNGMNYGPLHKILAKAMTGLFVVIHLTGGWLLIELVLR
jgi:hypothetical protein